LGEEDCCAANTVSAADAQLALRFDAGAARVL
jgi:hypothetical protein